MHITSVKSIAVVASGAVVAAAAATVFAVPAGAAPTRGTTHLHASRSHVVTIASSLRPGLAHLHNDGVRPITLIRKKHDGVDTLVRYANSDSAANSKKILKRFTLVAALDSHADAYVRLARGTYFVFDVSTGKITASKVRSVTVRGKTSNARRPVSTRNITIKRDGTLTGATTGGPRPYVRLRNSAKSVHAILVARVSTSATDAQITDALTSRSTEKLFALLDDSSLLGSVLVAYPHQDVTTFVKLARGRYLVLTDTAFDGGKTFRANTVRPLTLR